MKTTLKDNCCVCNSAFIKTSAQALLASVQHYVEEAELLINAAAK